MLAAYTRGPAAVHLTRRGEIHIPR